MSKWIPVFRSGTHTDSQGRQHTYSDDDLDQMVNNYEDRTNDAAVVKGHPKHNDPAFGWVDKLKRQGAHLMARFKDLVPEFVDAVNQKRFKYISISLYPGNRLRHVGFLGATPPAVKGLPAVSFSEEDEEYSIFDFSEDEWSRWRITSIGQLFQNIRDFILDKFDKQTADSVIPSFEVDYLKKDPPREEESEESAPAYSEESKSNTEVNMPEENAKAADQEQKIKDFSEKVTAVEGENRSLMEKNEELLKELRERDAREVKDFMDGKLKTKIKPVFRSGIHEILMNLKSEGKEVNFSETEKKSSYDVLAEFLESVPDFVEEGKELEKPSAKVAEPADFGENVDEDRLELYNEAMTLSKEKNISFTEAVDELTEKGGM